MGGERGCGFEARFLLGRGPGDRRPSQGFAPYLWPLRRRRLGCQGKASAVCPVCHAATTATTKGKRLSKALEQTVAATRLPPRASNLLVLPREGGRVRRSYVRAPDRAVNCGAATRDQRSTTYLVGVDGPIALVTPRVAAILERHADLSALRVRTRGLDPEATAVLEALRYAAMTWRGSATGTPVATGEELPAGLWPGLRPAWKKSAVGDEADRQRYWPGVVGIGNDVRTDRHRTAGRPRAGVISAE